MTRNSHEDAFKYYHGLGVRRSYRRVAEHYGVSPSTVKLWSREGGWRHRIIEREAEESRRLADSGQTGPGAESDRNLKIIDMAILKLARAIAEGRIRGSMGDLDRLVRLEERLTGVHGVSPKMLAKAAVYLESMQTMPIEQVQADFRRLGLELGIIKPEELVDQAGCERPLSKSGPRPGKVQNTGREGSIRDNSEST